MNLRTSSSAKRNAAAKCVESEQIEQLKLELKEMHRKLEELGNNSKDALEKEMNQLKGKLARMRANQNKQQLNIVDLEKKVAVLNDTINGKGLNQLKQNRNDRENTVDKRHKCTHCPYSTRWSYSLKMHMLIHTGQKPHDCEECGKQFRRSHHLSDHLRVHTGEKPFICQHCGKRFRVPCHLSNHQRVHTGERRFRGNVENNV
uniref:Protein krueppel n=1 Tax=Globodera pallida TaxID=36090 RepID=A0A183CAZ9_GLOPA